MCGEPTGIEGNGLPAEDRGLAARTLRVLCEACLGHSHQRVAVGTRNQQRIGHGSFGVHEPDMGSTPTRFKHPTLGFAAIAPIFAFSASLY